MPSFARRTDITDYNGNFYSDADSSPRGRMIKRDANVLGKYLRELATDTFRDPQTGETTPCIPFDVLYLNHPQLTLPELSTNRSLEKGVSEQISARNFVGMAQARAIHLKTALEELNPKHAVAPIDGHIMPSGMDWYYSIKAHSDYYPTKLENQIKAMLIQGGQDSVFYHLYNGAHIVDLCQGKEEWLPKALDATGARPASVTYVDIVPENNEAAKQNLRKSPFAPLDIQSFTGNCLDPKTYKNRLNELSSAEGRIVVCSYGASAQDFHLPEYFDFQTRYFPQGTIFHDVIDRTTEFHSLKMGYNRPPVAHLALNAVAQTLWWKNRRHFDVKKLGAAVEIFEGPEASYVYLTVFDKTDPESRQTIRPITKPKEVSLTTYISEAKQQVLSRLSPYVLAGSSADVSIELRTHAECALEVRRQLSASGCVLSPKAHLG